MGRNGRFDGNRSRKDLFSFLEEGVLDLVFDILMITYATSI